MRESSNHQFGQIETFSLSWLRYNEKLEFSKDQSQLSATNENVHWQCVTP